MKKKTLAALKASIAKWDKNAEAESPEQYLIGSRHCDLCARFLLNGCAGCPVFKSSGWRYCAATPFCSAAEARLDWLNGRGTKEDAHAAARKEAAFLRSLLPPGETA